MAQAPPYNPQQDQQYPPQGQYQPQAQYPPQQGQYPPQGQPPLVQQQSSTNVVVVQQAQVREPGVITGSGRCNNHCSI